MARLMRFMVPFLCVLLLSSGLMDPFPVASAEAQRVLLAGNELVYNPPPDWGDFWQKFNQVSDWNLEWFDGAQWVSVKSDLRVVRDYPEPNHVKLTLIFDASHQGKYRLTFAINKAVREYVTRLGQYQYELNYGNYSVVWDWSDAVSISGLVFTHGVLNDMFWFRMRRDNVPLGAHVEIDPSIIASYSETNQDTDYIMNDSHPSVAGTSAVGQSFQMGASSSKITSAVFYLKHAGVAPDGNLVVVLYAHSGVYGTSSVPTGAALATSGAIAANTLTGAFQLYTFTFTGAQQYTMAAGTYYCIGIQRDAAAGSVLVGTDATAPSHTGNCFRHNAGAWGAIAGRDTIFYVYGDYIPTNDAFTADPVFDPTAPGTATATVSDLDLVANLDTVEMQVYTNVTNLGLRFDGAGDYVTVLDDVSLNVTSVTIEAWVYHDGGLALIDTIVGKTNEWLRSDAAYLLWGSSGTSLQFRITNSTEDWDLIDTGNIIIANVWHHVVATYDQTAMRLYVNGGLVDLSTAITGPINFSPNDLYVGTHSPGLGELDAILDEVRVYDRALSPTEVAEHYAGEYKDENGLVLHLPFSFNTDDYSAWGNDGTAYGNPEYTFDYGETFTVTWYQATDVFLETSDPDLVCALSLDSASTNVDADTVELDFIFTITGASEGDCAVKLTTIDDEGLEDVDWYLAFAFSYWTSLGNLIDDLFEFFGIFGYMTTITAYINNLTAYFTDSLTNIVTLVVQQFIFINMVFGSFIYWFTELLGVLVDFVVFVQDIFDGVSVWYNVLGSWWDYVGWNNWAPAIPLFLFIWWISSIDKRADVTPGGEIQVFINDFNTAANVLGWFIGVFSFVANTVIDRAYGLIQAIV